jgi:succinoglycan biosynthesis protein ExoA
MDLPNVTVIVPMYNEEEFVANCLDSLLASDYPRERMEILAIDGRSTDRTLEIVREYALRHCFVRILRNEKRIQAAAMNLGIEAAMGEIILRADAHASYAPDYVRRCVETLESSGAANVGGALTALGRNWQGEAIAIGVTTPFGIGDAHYRYIRSEKWTDTVFPGAWRKATLQNVGGLREDCVVGEDYELNIRLRKRGLGIFLSPSIKCFYYPRRTLAALARQQFRGGFWRVKLLTIHPDRLRLRQVVPPVFLVGLCVCLPVGAFSFRAALVLPGIYAAASLMATARAVGTRRWRSCR